MNADRLLQEFDRLSDTRDAIPRLRRFILDMAVRGLIGLEDPSDEPVALLMKRIDSDTRDRSLRPAYKALVQAPILEVPFSIPASWTWTRLGRISNYLQRGKSPQYATTDGQPVVSQKCVRWDGIDLSVAKNVTDVSLARYDPERFLRDGDLLWNSTGTGTIGRVARAINPPPRLACDGHVTLIRCSELVPEYVRIWLRSDHVYGRIEGDAAGSTNQVELTLEMALSQIVPIPPLAEQERIVSKVGELMTVCDELETAKEQRELRRKRLSAASLARLTATGDTPGKVAEKDVAFFLAHSSRVVTKAEHVTDMRRTILDLAAQGRLTHTTTEWQKATVGDLCEFVTSGSRGWAEYYSSLGASFLRAQNVRFGFLRLDDLAHVTPPNGREGTRTRVMTNDIVVVITGAGVTNPALIDVDLGEAYVSQHLGLLRLQNPSYSRWTMLWLMAERGARNDLIERAYGAGKPGLNLNNLRTLPILVPELPEQERIVAKVDQMMAICDQLERSLGAAEARQTRALEAVLHQAVEEAGTSLPPLLDAAWSEDGESPECVHR